MTFTQAPRWDIWNLDAVKNFLLRVDRRWLNGAAVLNLWVRTLSQGSPKTKLTKLQLHVAAFFFLMIRGHHNNNKKRIAALGMWIPLVVA